MAVLAVTSWAQVAICTFGMIVSTVGAVLYDQRSSPDAFEDRQLSFIIIAPVVAGFLILVHHLLCGKARNKVTLFAAAAVGMSWVLLDSLAASAILVVSLSSPGNDHTFYELSSGLLLGGFLISLTSLVSLTAIKDTFTKKSVSSTLRIVAVLCIFLLTVGAIMMIARGAIARTNDAPLDGFTAKINATTAWQAIYPVMALVTAIVTIGAILHDNHNAQILSVLLLAFLQYRSLLLLDSDIVRERADTLEKASAGIVFSMSWILIIIQVLWYSPGFVRSSQDGDRAKEENNVSHCGPLWRVLLSSVALILGAAGAGIYSSTDSDLRHTTINTVGGLLAVVLHHVYRRFYRSHYAVSGLHAYAVMTIFVQIDQHIYDTRLVGADGDLGKIGIGGAIMLAAIVISFLTTIQFKFDRSAVRTNIVHALILGMFATCMVAASALMLSENEKNKRPLEFRIRGSSRIPYAGATLLCGLVFAGASLLESQSTLTLATFITTWISMVVLDMGSDNIPSGDGDAAGPLFYTGAICVLFITWICSASGWLRPKAADWASDDASTQSGKVGHIGIGVPIGVDTATTTTTTVQSFESDDSSYSYYSSSESV